jgi:hypothetical protein
VQAPNSMANMTNKTRIDHLRILLPPDDGTG